MARDRGRAAPTPGTDIVRIAGDGDRILYFLIWGAIALFILGAHLAIADEGRFADAFAYLYYIDNLYFYRLPDWFVFEPLSKIILLFLRGLTGSTTQTVSLAHYFIGTTYLIGMLAIFPPNRANWRGLLMAFALYGPQLAFVTIRATPAYMIASFAVLQAVRGNRQAFVSVVLATLFHISAVLALLPIVAVLFKARFRFLVALQRPKVMAVTVVAVLGIFAVGGSTIFAVTRTVFENIPFLGKYLVFAVGMSDAGGVTNIVNSFAVGHFVLFVAITGFTALFMLVNDRHTRSVAIFVIVSYVFYAFTFLAFSPIAAFRQTPFWVLPAFSIFSWERIGWRGAGQPLFLLLAAGIFAFQFSRVI